MAFTLYDGQVHLLKSVPGLFIIIITCRVTSLRALPLRSTLYNNVRVQCAGWLQKNKQLTGIHQLSSRHRS